MLFWAAAMLIFYVFVGYPPLLWLLQLLFRRPVRKEAIEPSEGLDGAFVSRPVMWHNFAK